MDVIRNVRERVCERTCQVSRSNSQSRRMTTWLTRGSRAAYSRVTLVSRSRLRMSSANRAASGRESSCSIVACFEFVELRRIVREPFTQIGGGRHLRFGPSVELRAFLGNTARPDAVRKDTVAVIVDRVVVDSFDVQHVRCHTFTVPRQHMYATVRSEIALPE